MPIYPIIPVIYYVVAGLSAGAAILQKTPGASILTGFSEIRDYQILIFIVGLITSILLLYSFTKPDKKDYLATSKKSIPINLALAIFGIMIFREMFDISGTSTVILNIMTSLSFPALLVIILIPFILGLLTGYNLGAVALSYFLVEPFFPLTGLTIIGHSSLIFMSALAGYLISPIHLCNVLSSDYLKTDTTRMYHMYIPAVVILLVVQILFIVTFYS